jgi:hypothetical protein
VKSKKLDWQLKKIIELLQNEQAHKADALLNQYLLSYPNNFDALYLKGVICGSLSNTADCVSYLLRAEKINSDHELLQYNLAKALSDVGNDIEAISHHKKVLELSPQNYKAWNNYGNSLSKLGRFNDALIKFDHAIALNGQYAEAYFNRGVVLKELKRFQESIDSYEKAIEIKSSFPEAFINRAILFQELSLFKEALESIEIAIGIKCDSALAHCNRGAILYDLKKFDEAAKSYERAIELDANYAEAHFNKGNALKELRQIDQAISSYEKAIELRPEYSEAHYNKALLLLLIGDLRNGFMGYEWRWKNSEISKLAGEREFDVEKRWDGNVTLVNKTILIYSEQGLGDTINFCRYVGLLEGLGAKIILEVQKPLVELLNNIKGVKKVITRGDKLPLYDYFYPLMSLPFAFRTELSSIPVTIPYVSSNRDKKEEWARRLGAKRKFRVGLVWSGSLELKDDKNRSIKLNEITPHLPSSVDYVSLQKEVRDNDKNALAESAVEHFGEYLNDFSDTAGLCDLMDLVVSVDTSVAHLAGALGKPVWLLLPYTPDWRWLLDREDSYWYPNIKLYRQGPDRKCDSVLSNIKKDLMKIL